ncbi:hypothetical protein [Nannocystis pusilla]|uniref:hypothetical protein n=1 Tax=Nannocystis pusilla TaxID=889268 RepID=UPI003B76BE85
MSAETRHAAAARVTCEDLVVFLNACFCCTGQREFYSDGHAQTVSIEFLHDYIRGNYRRLYARTLAAGVNHFNRARIVTELLASSRHLAPGERRDEGRLVVAALRSLPAPRAYRALLAVRARGVNNRRLRAIVREFLSSRPDLQFDAIKYRDKLRDLILHTHLRLPGELGGFLFKGWKQRRYATPLLETFRQAHFSDEAMYELPFTVAEGMAARRNIDRAVFLRKIAPRLTALERLRLQNAAAREGVKELAIDLARAGLTRVAIYLLSLPSAERRERRAELQAALDGAARRCLREAPLALGRVAAVLDRSYSTAGSPDKPRRSLAVALGVDALLRAASAEYMSFGHLPPTTRCWPARAARPTSPAPCWTRSRPGPTSSSSSPTASTTTPPAAPARSAACSRPASTPRAAPPSSTSTPCSTPPSWARGASAPASRLSACATPRTCRPRWRSPASPPATSPWPSSRTTWPAASTCSCAAPTSRRWRTAREVRRHQRGPRPARPAGRPGAGVRRGAPRPLAQRTCP